MQALLLNKKQIIYLLVMRYAIGTVGGWSQLETREIGAFVTTLLSFFGYAFLRGTHRAPQHFSSLSTAAIARDLFYRQAHILSQLLR